VRVIDVTCRLAQGERLAQRGDARVRVTQQREVASERVEGAALLGLRMDDAGHRDGLLAEVREAE
jgi:hypothetical protein